MKVSTEKLPKSLIALDIELDRDQVERGLDRAARRISQKVNIPGFRKGKAPRFIVENYYGRSALVEEASDDLINRSFRQALEQEQIDPVGPASLESANFDGEPYTFRVTVPVAPTVTLPDYRNIRVPMEVREVTDEMLDEAMRDRRERHVVLKEPEEPRPAQDGDQLTVQIESFVDGEPVEEREEGQEVPESTLVLEKDRLVPGLYDGVIGIAPDETREVTVHMPEDHNDERVAGKDVNFKVTLKKVQARLLPEWDELPTLEEFDGTLDELRAKTRDDLETAARNVAERDTVNEYIRQLVEQTEYDIPDALVTREADRLLHEQEAQFARYGISLEQMLQYRGQTHDDAVEELKPQGEERLKNTLALQQVVAAEGLEISESDVDEEVGRIVESYNEEERDMARAMLASQLRPQVASSVLDQKLRERLLEIATGAAPEVIGEPVEVKPESTAEAEGPTNETEAEAEAVSVVPKPETTAEAEGPTNEANA